MFDFRAQLRRLLKTVRLFGLGRGLLVYISYAKHRMNPSEREKVTRLDIPGMPYPVWLRPGTSDWSVLEQIFLDDEYGFRSWPEHEEAIYAHYRRTLEQS